MSLTETVDFDKEGKVVHFSPIKRFFLILVIVLVALLAFGIGRLSGAGNREPIKIEMDSNLQASMDNGNSLKIANSKIENLAGVFASSKGKKYYYPGCSNTISAANKITFSTPKEAESAGFTLASNCHPK